MRNSLQRIMFLFSLLLSVSLYVENGDAKESVRVVDFAGLEPYLKKNNDTIYVVNFWATWCAPCIKEIPYFEQLGAAYRMEKVKVLMVSLDMANQLQSRLIPFMEKEMMRNEVILLDDPRSNRWIPLVDEHWSGVIPATLIYGKGFRKFYQKEFTFEELDGIISSLLSN